MKEDITIWMLFGLLSMVDPHAAMGAAFGCAFHLTLPRSDNENRYLLAFFSYGLGYGAGYAELRDANVFSKEGILEIARGATQYFSKELFEMELERWPDTFVQENTVTRIGRWIEKRLEVLDAEYNYS